MSRTGAFTPVLAKHSKNFSLVNAVSIGVDRMQRNFEPLAQRIELARASPYGQEIHRGPLRAVIMFVPS
jgi:hypothetical protein